MSRPTVILIEDEPRLRRIIKTTLEANGLRCIESGLALQGLRDAQTYRPDLILLDLGLPDHDGIEVIRDVRKWSSKLPVVVLSARVHETAKIAAFDAGADDYLTKPFGVGELLARLRVALRHAAFHRTTDANGEFVNGDLRVDLLRRKVFLKEQELHLTTLEYRLLAVLIRNAGRVVTYQELLNDVWGPNKLEQIPYVRTYIAELRRKLECDVTRPAYLRTEIGVGYQLLTG
jgi:two-component system, OmpR family, KDP operon response regulator KdpE